VIYSHEFELNEQMEFRDKEKPERRNEFKGWLVARYYPSTAPDLMWVSVRDKDLYARYRKLDPDRWGVDLADLGAPGRPAVAFDPENRRHRELARELEGYRASLLAAYARSASEPSLQDGEVLERLRALGYVK